MQNLKPLLASLGLSLTGFAIAIPAIAQVKTPAVVGYDFERPTFDRQPLPDALDDAQSWEIVGQNAFVVQDYRNSLAAYGKAIDLANQGDRPDLLEQRGWVYYRLAQFQRAEQDFTQAATLYWQQQDYQNYLNVKQIQLFVEQQARSSDSLS